MTEQGRKAGWMAKTIRTDPSGGQSWSSWVIGGDGNGVISCQKKEEMAGKQRW